MMDAVLDAAAWVDRLLWGPWTLVFIGCVSVYLTVRTRFFQLRGLRLIVRATFGSLLRGPATAPGRPSPPLEAAAPWPGGPTSAPSPGAPRLPTDPHLPVRRRPASPPPPPPPPREPGRAA
jgi:hypothetical protein